MSSHNDAVLASVRYSETQKLWELKLYDAAGNMLPFVQYVNPGNNFMTDEYEPGRRPPTGAGQATTILESVGLNVGNWEKDNHGFIAKVSPR